MDFLQQTIFSNTIRSYLTVSLIIFATLLLKRFLSRYIAAIFCRILKRIWSGINKKTFIDLVVEPLEWVLIILISVFAIDKLNFPEELHYSIYGHTTEDIIGRIANGVIILSFTWLMLRVVDFAAMVLEEKANLTVDARDNQLIVFFRDFLKVIIGVGGILLIVKACFNQPVGQLLTGLSIVGAALALAAKESLENLIASFIIFFDKPFFTGDTVKVNSITGKIEKIGLRSTRIRTADKTLVTVPNKQMVDTIVDNWSMRTKRRAEVKLELAVTNSQQQIQSLADSLKKMLETKKDEILSYSVFFKDINKNSILIVVEYFTAHNSLTEFDTLKEKINMAVIGILKEKDITLFSPNDNKESN